MIVVTTLIGPGSLLFGLLLFQLLLFELLLFELNVAQFNLLSFYHKHSGPEVSLNALVCSSLSQSVLVCPRSTLDRSRICLGIIF